MLLLLLVVVPKADGCVFDEPNPEAPNPDEVLLLAKDPKGSELALLLLASRNPDEPNADRPNPLDVDAGLFVVPNPLEPNALSMVVVAVAGLLPNPALPNPEDPNVDVALELPNPVEPIALDVLLGFPNPEFPNPVDCDEDDDVLLLLLLVLRPDEPNPLEPNPEFDEFVANGFD